MMSAMNFLKRKLTIIYGKKLWLYREAKFTWNFITE
jgi:hypothetical protein